MADHARVKAGTITGIITSRRGWMGLSGALEQPAHAPMHAICRLRKGQMNEQTGNMQELWQCSDTTDR